MARSTGTPATPSASSIARRIEVAVAPRLAISPLRSPFDSAAPIEINFATPESSTSLRMAHVFVLPTSSATKYLSFFVNPPLLRDPLPARAGTRPNRIHSKTLTAAYARTALAEARSEARSEVYEPPWSCLRDSPPPAGRTANPRNPRARRSRATGRYSQPADDNDSQNRSRRSVQESETNCLRPSPLLSASREYRRNPKDPLR